MRPREFYLPLNKEETEKELETRAELGTSAGLGPYHPGLGLPELALSWGAGSLATFAPAVFVAQLPGGRWPLQLLRPPHSSDVMGCAYF